MSDNNSFPADIIIMTSVIKHLDYVLSPLLFVLGGIGNTLCIIVYVQIIIGKSNGAVSSSIILLFLACSDTIFLCEESLYSGFWVYTGEPLEAEPLACKLKWFIQGTSYHVSGLTIAIFTMERMFAVIYPMKVHRIWTRRRTLMIVSGTVVLWALAESQFFYGIDRVPLTNETVLFRDLACRTTTLEYRAFLIGTWAYIEAFVGFLEILTIFGGNAIIIWTLHRRNVHSTIGNTSVQNREITRRLIAVSLVHLLASIPWVVIVTSQWELGNVHGSDKDMRNFLYFQFSLLLLHIQSSISFLLYTISGASFRHKVKELLINIFEKLTCRSINRPLKRSRSSCGGNSSHGSQISKRTQSSEINVPPLTKPPLEEQSAIDANDHPQIKQPLEDCHCVYDDVRDYQPVEQSSIDTIFLEDGELSELTHSTINSQKVEIKKPTAEILEASDQSDSQTNQCLLTVEEIPCKEETESTQFKPDTRTADESSKRTSYSPNYLLLEDNEHYQTVSEPSETSLESPNCQISDD